MRRKINCRSHIILLLILNMNIILDTGAIYANRAFLENQESSNGINLKFYENHSAIIIQGNNELELYASQENWTGDGGESNPFVISGYRIDGISSDSQCLIWIKNTDHHCIITDNVFLNANSSIIYLEDTNNIKIIGNTISSSKFEGVVVNASQNILITDNTIYENYGNGISFNSCNNSVVSNNKIFKNNGNGTGQSESQNITITNNTIFNNNGYGVSLFSSMKLIITNNNIFGNNNTGIYVVNSRNTSILENEVHDSNNYEGITLISSETNFIVKNTVYNNSRIGIAIFGSNKNIIINNTVFGNNRFGILIEYSNYNNISSNVVFKTNYYDGIQLYYGENNYVSSNRVYENNRAGILFYASNKNVITDNLVFKNDGLGVAFHISGDNEISNNLFYRNNEGIHIWSGAFNRIINNVFYESNGTELSIYTNDTNITQNDFYIDSIDAKLHDNGEGNEFNLNYYSSWISPDVDADGIVDLPFTIEGSALNQDSSPRTSPMIHILLPPIIISPKEGEFFSGEISIEWETSFDSFNHDISYSLYYSSDRGKTWTRIINLITTTFYLWNISTLPKSSDYMIKVVVVCSEDLKYEVISEKPFTIENHLLSSIHLFSPGKGDKLSGTITINWSEVIDSMGHQVVYSLYLSADDGTTWTLLAQNLTQTIYEWDTTTVGDGSDYKIMLIAQCSEGESTTYILQSNFTIQNIPRNPLEGLIPILIIIIGIIFGVLGIALGIYRANLDISPHKLEDFIIGLCIGSFSGDHWKILGKNKDCPFEEQRLLSMIEFSAVSYRYGEQGTIYGPFPQIMTPDLQERQWLFLSFSFSLKAESNNNFRKVKEEKTPETILLIYYESKYENIISRKRKSIQKYLNSVVGNLERKEKWFNEIETKIIEILLA